MKKWEIHRGFSLLELVLALSLMIGLFTSVIPSFLRVAETAEMKRLAAELTGFIHQAKSEAVFRNQTLYAHITFAKDSDYTQPDWRITLTDSNVTGAGTILSILNGYDFDGLTVRHSYTSEQISFDGIRGRAKSGSFHFFPSSDRTKKLELRTSNPPGRVKICATNQALYGYLQC